MPKVPPNLSVSRFYVCCLCWRRAGVMGAHLYNICSDQELDGPVLWDSPGDFGLRKWHCLWFRINEEGALEWREDRQGPGNRVFLPHPHLCFLVPSSFLRQAHLKLAHKVPRPFFLSISILTPLPSIQGKHIQPVFKVVKLFLQGPVVDLKGMGLSDSPMSRIQTESPLPNTQSPSEWQLLFSGTWSLWLQPHSGLGLPHSWKWSWTHLGTARMPN